MADLVPTIQLVRATPALFAQLELEWQGQLEAMGEEIDSYSPPFMNHARMIVAEPGRPANGMDYGIYLFVEDRGNKKTYTGLLHANTGRLPHTTGVTLRFNWMLLAPVLDFQDVSESEKAALIASIFHGGIGLTKGEMKANHLKVRLRDIEDRRLMLAFVNAMKSMGSDLAVALQGNWVHINDIP